MSVDDRLRRAASEFEAELRQVRIPEPPVLGGGGFRMAGWLLVAVALVAVAWMLRGAGPDTAVHSTAPPPGPVFTTATEQLPDLGWRRVSLPEQVAPLNSAMVWTGSELIIWGGELYDERSTGDPGVAYSPDSNTWRELPPSPKPAASYSAAVWTGSEVVICCGVRIGSRGVEVGYREAAAYDPVSNSWRELADAPVLAWPAVGVWTGSEMLVVAGRQVLGYEPGTDRWRTLPDPPAHLGRLNKAVWTGTELIVWPSDVARSVARGLALSPETGVWDLLPEPPSWPAAPDVVWTGEELIVWGGLPQEHESSSERAVGSSLDPTTRAWRPLPDALPEPDGCECNLGSQTMLWTGAQLLVSTGFYSSGLSDEPLLLAYDPSEQEWLLIGRSPVSGVGAAGAIMAGDRAIFRSERFIFVSPPGWTAQGELSRLPNSREARPGPETVVFTVPIHLTGDGLIFAREHQLGETAQRSPTPLEIVALSGARVTVELPRDFQVGAVGRHAGLRSPGRFVVGWAAYARGEGLWAFADLAAELVDVVELNGGLLAFYDAGQVEGTRFFTLWQGDLFDLVSGYFDSVEEAADFLATMDIEETPAGPVIAKPGWEIHDEDLVVTVFVPGDSGRGDAILDIRPVTSDRATFAGPGVQGRWGEFLLVGDGIEGGIIFRSTTAWASLTPGGVPRIDSLSEASLYDRFNVVWNDR